MRGRKPKPLEQKLAEGNPGKRALNRAGLAVPNGKPEPLEDLGEAEHGVWCEVLEVAPHVKRADSEILALFCVWVVIGRQAMKQLKATAGEDGLLKIAVTTQRGTATNPLITTLAKATELIRTLANELGLSPASRERLSNEEEPGLFDGGWNSLDVLPDSDTTQ
jgi:P27 family predicted phage terminase small subunit